MRISLPFHILVFFMSVLTFHIPFAAFAQENSIQIKAGTTASQETNIVKLEAEAAAMQDARSDTNEILWFGTGFAAFAIGCPVGACTGCCIGSIVSPSYFYDSDSTAQGIGSLIGFTVGVLVPFIGIYRYKSHPSPERLMGKSPEYVEFYTDAYKAKTRLIQTATATAGAAIGCGLITLGCLMSL